MHTMHEDDAEHAAVRKLKINVELQSTRVRQSTFNSQFPQTVEGYLLIVWPLGGSSDSSEHR